MLHNLIRIKKGKQEIVMTDVLTKVQARMKQLKASQRGLKQVDYKIVETDSNIKYKEKVNQTRYSSGDSYRTPRLTKWN